MLLKQGFRASSCLWAKEGTKNKPGTATLCPETISSSNEFSPPFLSPAFFFK